MIYYSKNECDIKNIIDYLNIHGIYVDNPREINYLWHAFSRQHNVHWLLVDDNTLEAFYVFVRYGEALEELL